MNYVYILQSLDEEKVFYLGSTKNLKQRIFQHNNGENSSTKHRQWRLVYYEAYLTLQAAREREHKLKSYGRSYQLLIERVKKSINN